MGSALFLRLDSSPSPKNPFNHYRTTATRSHSPARPSLFITQHLLTTHPSARPRSCPGSTRISHPFSSSLRLIRHLGQSPRHRRPTTQTRRRTHLRGRMDRSRGIVDSDKRFTLLRTWVRPTPARAIARPLEERAAEADRTRLGRWKRSRKRRIEFYKLERLNVSISLGMGVLVTRAGKCVGCRPLFPSSQHVCAGYARCGSQDLVRFEQRAPVCE